jgi:hypothetical protein
MPCSPDIKASTTLEGNVKNNETERRSITRGPVAEAARIGAAAPAKQPRDQSQLKSKGAATDRRLLLFFLRTVSAILNQ